MIKSSSISGGVGENNRNEYDFYFTPKEATLAVMEFLNIPKHIKMHEPACGEGHISKALEGLGYTVTSADIRCTGYGSGGIDYLIHPFCTDCIITNPPFVLAQQFIEKAITEAPLVIMLLKAHYWHTQKRYDLFCRTKPSFILPLTWRPNMSPDRGKSPTLDFQWTVWDKSRNNECVYKPLNKPTINP